jgi:hypothetical protein
VLADMAIQFRHEALAEAHDLGIALAFGIEVRTALAAADGHAGQGILEDLLETQKLDDAQVHGRMEAQAAFVGAEGAVEFHPETAVDVHPVLVILPGHPEDDLPLRFADPLDDFVVAELRVLAQHRSQGLQHFANGLVEFDLARIPGQNLLVNRCYFFVQLHCHDSSCLCEKRRHVA